MSQPVDIDRLIVDIVGVPRIDMVERMRVIDALLDDEPGPCGDELWEGQ